MCSGEGKVGRKKKKKRILTIVHWKSRLASFVEEITLLKKMVGFVERMLLLYLMTYLNSERICSSSRVTRANAKQCRRSLTPRFIFIAFAADGSTINVRLVRKKKRRRKDREKKKGKEKEKKREEKWLTCGNSDIGLDLGSSSDLCDIFTIRREFAVSLSGLEKIIGTIPVHTPPRRQINPFVCCDTIYQKLRYLVSFSVHLSKKNSIPSNGK